MAGLRALMAASVEGHLVEYVRALLVAGADVLQLRDDGTCALELGCEHAFGALQLLCAYAPSRAAACAHLGTESSILPECARWLEAPRRWTSPLHRFELLPLERVRALLVEGADVRAGDGEADAPTPLSLATARLQRGNGSDDGRAALIVRVAALWSPRTHALFPAAAKAARAVELVRLGWLLARHLQGVRAGTAEVEVAFRDVWLGHIMPHAIQRP